MDPAIDNSDAELVGRVLAGDREAFGGLVARHQNAVFGLPCSQLRERSDLDDLAQEVFLQAYRQLGSLRDAARFRSWLVGIARHVALRWLRTSRSEARVIDAVTRDQGAAPEAGEPSPLEALERGEVAAAVWAAVDGLPESTREAVLLHYVGGLNDREIADAVGISASAARSRLHYGRERLRD